MQVDIMKAFIPSNCDTIRPNGTFGTGVNGISFWQKTGFLRRGSKSKLKTVVSFVRKNFSAVSVTESAPNVYFIHFEIDSKHKFIFLTLSKKRGSNHLYIDGSASTAYTDAEFHLFVLDVIGYICKLTGCKFYVDDSTGYLLHHSKEQLQSYIDIFKSNNPHSKEELETLFFEHTKRPLDINEILSRKTEKNVVTDAYEYFMRQSNWQIDDRFCKQVKIFLLCINYDGDVSQGGLTLFLKENDRNTILETIAALHSIKAFKSENLLKKRLKLCPYSITDDDKNKISKLDIQSYNDNSDIHTLCYRYLIKHKEQFKENLDYPRHRL